MNVKVLDLFCGAGGAAYGIYKSAKKNGIEVTIVGIDIKSQKNYPFMFIQSDFNNLPVRLEDFDFVWASPPCQAYTFASKRWKKVYPDLIRDVRYMLVDADKVYVIENVCGAPMRRDLKLCGQMFNLKIIRHRIFEIRGFKVPQPAHPNCRGLIKKGLAYTVAGNGGDSKSCKIDDWRDAMGIDWMDRNEITQAVPPAYSEYIFDYYIKEIIKRQKIGIEKWFVKDSTDRRWSFDKG